MEKGFGRSFAKKLVGPIHKAKDEAMKAGEVASSRKTARDFLGKMSPEQRKRYQDSLIYSAGRPVTDILTIGKKKK